MQTTRDRRADVAKDLAAVLVLLLLVMGWEVFHRHVGLSYSPDSGYYLHVAARLHLAFDYRASSSMYGPLLPLVTSLAMTFAALPGQAATLVLAAALFAGVIAFYALARLSGYNVWTSLGWSCLGLFNDASMNVFRHVWSEGLTIALLLLFSFGWADWIARHNRTSLALGCGAAALLPLAKYSSLAICAWLVTMIVLEAWMRRHTRPSLRSLLVGSATLLPIAAHLIYNKLRRGMFTGHPASNVSFWDNLTDLLRAVAFETPILVWPFFLLSLSLLVIGARRREQREQWRWFLLLAQFGTLVSYAAALIAGATLFRVDRLDARLTAPLIVLVCLISLQGTAVALELVSATRRVWLTRLSTACGVLGAAMVLITQAQVAHRTLTSSSDNSTASYEAGFANSAGARSLGSFYAAQLRSRPSLSVTLLEATPEPGRVRRDILSLADALARPPIPDHAATLLEESLERAVVATELDGTRRSLSFLPGRIPELKTLKSRAAHHRTVGDDALRARIHEIIERISLTMRKAGVVVHWLIVPTAARWFAIAPNEALGTVRMEQRVNLIGFDAYRLRLLDVPIGGTTLE